MARKKKRPHNPSTIGRPLSVGERATPARISFSAGQGAAVVLPLGASQERRAWPSLPVAIAAALLAAGVALVFGQTVRNEFNYVYDDNEYILLNPFVKQGLSLRSIAWAFSTVREANWHPLTWISHMVDCQMFGLWAGGHHLTGTLLHCAVAVILFFALRALTGHRWMSALVAALFAVHPLRAESVAWAAERKDVLSGFFFVCALCVYAQYVRRPTSLWWYLCLVLVYALGLMCKPMLVTLPLVLLLLDFWPLRRWSVVGGRWSVDGGGWWVAGDTAATPNPQSLLVPTTDPRPPTTFVTLLLEKVPLFILSATSCAITLFAQRQTMATVAGVSIPFRLANATVGYAMYLRDWFCPAWLAPLYPLPDHSLPALLVIVSAVVLAAITAAAIVLRRQRPYLLFGWLWYLIVLIPVIGLVQVGSQTRADRYTYLALIGPSIALVWTAGSWLAAHPRYRAPLSLAVALLLAVVLAAGWQQAAMWHDAVTLWRHAIVTGNDSASAETNLGRALDDRGESFESMAHLRRGVELTPHMAVAFTNLGTALARRGQVRQAIDYYHQAEELDPNDIHTQQDMGQAFTELGQPDEAIAHFRKATEIKPEIAGNHYNLAYALAGRGLLEDAVREYEEALRLQPDYALACNNVANLYLRLGRTDDAMARYRQAVQLDPNYAEAHNNLGLLLARRGERAEAVLQFQQALQAKPDYAEAHNNLGVVLAGDKHYAEAAEHFQKALAIEPANTFAHANLGRALNRLGQNAAAAAELRKALQLSPGQPAVLLWLSWVLATAPDDKVRNGAEAVALAEKAAQIAGSNDPTLLDTLAAAYAEAGRWPEAIATARRAQAAATQAGNQALAQEIQGRIDLYQGGKAFRDQALGR